MRLQSGDAGGPILRTASGHSPDDRISGMDGLRACAILVVMVSHYAPHVAPQYPFLVTLFPGKLGVFIFFIISGFLIGKLLLREFGRSQTIALGQFYARRALRLSPALIVYVVAFYLLYSLTARSVDGWAFVAAAG